MRSTAPQDAGEPQDRRERRRNATRERLLAAALELFAAHGYAATTYEHIAERADVGRQTAFNHFRRKEDFVTAWVQQRHERLDQHEAADALGAERPAVESLADELRALAELNEQDYALARELHDGGVLHTAFSLGAATPRAILAAVTRGQRRGEIRRDLDPGTLADMIFDGYVTALSRWLRGEGAFSLTEALLTRLAVLADGFTVDSRGSSPS
ncbi:putative acrEF/envCD operon repressor [Streptomyces sp. YIM 121038]|uniref:TetR/AcrR family transcriptional regulator n=1 Tax=Streptomyces sp. YIM 121038 TaxID=2136401 RepID=UPI0011655BEF|nr:TetR/AcrR family transcriptional regulator [Streptomyces sp. YIM 121038]QCX74665.1 putative acrEF/envCD operon repressor [Streptomyces sp. YIM 121038]